MNFYCKTEILASIIFVQLNANSTKGFSDPYVGITFEDENPMCDLSTPCGYCTLSTFNSI
jgi:hypothetical protein